MQIFCSLFQNTEVFETRSYFSPLSDRQVDGSVPIFDRENWGHKVYYDATEMLLNRWLISLVCVPRGKVCVISVCGCVFPLVRLVKLS